MAGKFEDDVIISGVGQSSIGRRLGRSALALTLDAITAAVADAGLSLDEIGGLAAFPRRGTSVRPGVEGPAQLGPVVSGSLAISAGLTRHVVVFRTVTEGSVRDQARAMDQRPVSGTSPWITAFGGGPAPLGYALLARRHFHEYGTSREQLAQIALTARKHAGLNPHALFREPLTLDDYPSARMIADPLCLYDCDVHCDGSTAIVLSHAGYAADAPGPVVRIEATGVAPPLRSQYAQHADLLPGRRAAQQMWKRTDLLPGDVDVAGLYDGFSILTMFWLEAL